MKKQLIGLLTAVFLFGTLSEASAVGVLFVKRFHSTETYQKIWIKSVDVTTAIQDQIASTQMDEVFHNDMNWRVEAFFVFPLPNKAVVTRLVYWYNGKRYEAAIRERRQAVQEYEREVRRLLDPALLEHLGNNLFRLRIAPVDPNSDIRFEITYTELLTYDFGAVTYKFFLNTTALSPKPLQRVSLSIDARSQFPYKMFRSPSHGESTAIKIEKLSDHHYKVVFGDENFYPDRDFTLKFETVRQGFQVNVLTYKPVPSDSFGTDSFYALWVTPPDSLAPDEIIPKSRCYSILGPSTNIDFDDAAIFWTSFYHLMFKHNPKVMKREAVLSNAEKVAKILGIKLNYFGRKSKNKGVSCTKLPRPNKNA